MRWRSGGEAARPQSFRLRPLQEHQHQADGSGERAPELEEADGLGAPDPLGALSAFSILAFGTCGEERRRSGSEEAVWRQRVEATEGGLRPQVTYLVMPVEEQEQSTLQPRNLCTVSICE
ncbi:hypothetical protein NDU88_001553 [Pleurodeles waltl]|uniref:Uncharacterized protein n=1 Tax=Pleurodeles waltl TaxID=8319 RepID=A0AAV7VA88_PLEWA|nr:hypothetical protein NDU88_001553 [Pleurodeles waltl]